MADLPVFDPTTAAIAQNDPWSCAPTTTRWMLFSVGRTPGEEWIEQAMIAEGVANPEVGCTDKSGAGLEDFVRRHYGYSGGHNGYEASFDELVDRAGMTPLGFSGGAWYHWSGIRGYSAADDVLLLSNPASGWHNVYQTMNREQFAALGPWSYFWIDATLASEPPLPPISGIDLSPWIGKVGSGLLEMMAADSVSPAQDFSTWLPLGRQPAQIEECIAVDGTVYRWLLATGTGHRYRPS